MRYLFIINPTSGKGQYHHVIKEINTSFIGKDIEIKPTTKRGDAITFAKNTDADIVVAAGGDGTVNEVVNGIMQNRKGRKRPRLGILPLGTSNMVARSFNIPQNIKNALDLVRHNRRKDMDIGKVNSRYFAIGCGIGLDAEMYRNVEPKIKKVFGEIAYPLSFIKTLFNYEPKLLDVCADGCRYQGYYVLVCNIAKFHNSFRLIKDTSDDDGKFDVFIFKKKNIGDIFWYVFGMAAQQTHNLKDLHCFKAEKLKITSSEKVIAHADAEIIGSTPVTIKMHHKAIELIC